MPIQDEPTLAQAEKQERSNLWDYLDIITCTKVPGCVGDYLVKS